eukprot:156255-Prymnesium_polylepis.1
MGGPARARSRSARKILKPVGVDVAQQLTARGDHAEDGASPHPVAAQSRPRSARQKPILEPVDAVVRDRGAKASACDAHERPGGQRERQLKAIESS